MGIRHFLIDMAKVAVTDGLEKKAISRLKRAKHEVIELNVSAKELRAGALKEFEAVIVRGATKLTQEVINASPNLRVIARAGVGVDNVDLEAASDADIIVINAPLASTQSVIELTISHLLASVRYVPQADRAMRGKKWAKKTLVGTELKGKRLGLIGFGRIGQGVAKIASALGMEVHAYDPYLSEKVAKQHGATLHKNIDALFERCTHISVHCNYSEQTHHLVNAERIQAMPDKGPDGVLCGRHLVNCARGGIVDEDAVSDLLKSDLLTSAALDVFEQEPPDWSHPLFKQDGFHGTPHIGASTLEAQQRVGLDIAKGVISVLKGEKPKHCVNR